MRLVGAGDPVLVLGASGRAFRGDAGSGGFLLAGLTIDAGDAPAASVIELRGTPSGRIERLRLLRPGDGILLADGTRDVTIADLTVLGSRLHGVTIADSQDNLVDGAELHGQRGFGVILRGDSHGNRLTRLRTVFSGLELVGMTWQTHGNSLSDSTALRTGDNCYSITGSHNRLENLTGRYCAGNGIAFYGSWNVLRGGTFTGNSQRHEVRRAWSAGIAFLQGFGGVAQHNQVAEVVVDDDQPRPTQQLGVMTHAALYRDWAPGERVAAGEYRRAGLRLYRAAAAGITGPTPPAGEGQAADGGVAWAFVNRFEATPLPDFNRAEGIDIRRVARAPREDLTPAQHNQGTR
ncbi:right-handed parallel beta-helix repeat-containing protein, partial [Paracraurococcus ruber]|uniref:Right handed beta helix domain-containing protein n=2 Tax=Paracraurococcus ruber TaxID=77675 RepID=A0ABS1CW62_9PROT